MPTYAQLQSEAVWGQEIQTDELDWLVDQLCAHFGVPRGNGGIKGDNRHLNGGHRSQAWIKRSRYCTSRTYTVEAGLTAEQERDLAAFDVTLPHEHMLTISRNADRATRAGQLEELVEWFGNVDGDQRVDGWNNIENRVASSDDSHLWHFHGRIRRSLLRDMATMRRVFAALTGTGADDMSQQAEDAIARIDGRIAALYYGMEGNPYGSGPMKGEANQVGASLSRLEAAAAADEVRDKATLAAIQAITGAGGPDAAPIVQAIRDATAETHGYITQLQSDLAAEREESARLRQALGDALKA